LAGSLAGAGLLMLLLMLALTSHLPVHASGSILKVPDDYPTIQAAIDAATDGDEIWVQAGNYNENLSISKGIALVGGWDAEFEEQSPGASTIDGQGLGRAISITCALSDTVVTVDGFAVQGGNATGLGGAPDELSAVGEPPIGAAGIPTRRTALAPDPLTPTQRFVRLQAELADAVEQGLYPGGPAAYQAMLHRVRQQIARLDQASPPSPAAAAPTGQGPDCGGGVYSWNASLHLLDSTLTANIGSLSADGCGGGVFVGQSPPGGVLIRGNTFLQNIASGTPSAIGHGGGLYAVDTPGLIVADNVFQENAGMSEGLISTGAGGGLFVQSSPNAVVRDNLFLRNTANAGWYSYDGLGGGALLRLSDGATITRNEFRENLGFLHAQGGGGGLAVVRSNEVAVVDNDIIGNWGGTFQRDLAGAEGGGIILWQTGSVIVMDNTISGNAAALSGARSGASFGGGLEGEMWFGGRLERNLLSDNVASQTGIGRGGGASLWGVSDVWVTDNAFTGNAATLGESSGGGGGLLLLNTQDCRLQENEFRDNLAAASGEGRGGGLCVWSEPSNTDTTANANLFLGNRAAAELDGAEPSEGGACFFDSYGLTFTNNVVAGNSADLGGGLYLPFVEDAILTNNTLAGNSTAGILVDQYNRTPITFTNNIVVNHTVGISVTQGATATVRYTLWHGNGVDIAGAGVVTQTHPIHGVPAFTDPAADDYRLTVTSAARDAGDPAGVPPAPAHDANGTPRPQGAAVDIGAYEWKGHWKRLPLVTRLFTPRVGWAIGNGPEGAEIVHTSDGGLNWQAQGNPAAWTGMSANDISAVDDQTAWAALGSTAGTPSGAILHTTDGGVHWVPQAIPAGLTGGIKGVKGLSRSEAWAASLYGTVLHTTDGGAVWNVVPHPTTAITDVNRIDALGGADVWIASPNEDHGGNSNMIHTQDNGLTWWLEALPDVPSGNGPMTVNAVSPLVAWTALNRSGNLYRTLDGGDKWVEVAKLAGMGDFDDLCAAGADGIWGVQTLGYDSGWIWRVHVAADGTVDSRSFTPASTAFSYEGVTCLDEHTAWVVGWNALHTTGLPLGVIVITHDGGEHWMQGSAPDDIEYWKVSFVGARR
jgi:photosystem II stability/assembly factor-like uncharacterized protein/nitrous oxidase accessory protein NosD